MDFKTAMHTCVVKKYADFNGRAARSEFWYFFLAAFLLGFIVNVLTSFLGAGDVFRAIPGLALLLPWYGVSVRRLHDLNRSGWWFLAFLIPLVGLILMLCWFTRKGTTGPNQYGEDPLYA
ncbi:MAG: DUF805 domain-containing protein [Deltaproteobacteria bacterium]|jgi:uncharacterized membrane protein YhaH (DUF805 family)|nr:DUF805 domain-containing protein [Deltaproteobacteria bacterium]